MAEKRSKLNPREQKFIAHYAVHFNGTRAIKFAGYETTAPAEYAYELLRKPHIQAAVREVTKDLGDLHFQLANEVTADLTVMKNADRTAIFDADGNVIDPAKWPDECKALLCGVETEEHMTGEGAAAMMVRTKKVKLESRKSVLDSLAKITGQFVDRTQFLDRFGKPTDPAAGRAVIELTVGERQKGTK